MTISEQTAVSELFEAREKIKEIIRHLRVVLERTEGIDHAHSCLQSATAHYARISEESSKELRMCRYALQFCGITIRKNATEDVPL